MQICFVRYKTFGKGQNDSFPYILHVPFSFHMLSWFLLRFYVQWVDHKFQFLLLEVICWGLLQIHSPPRSYLLRSPADSVVIIYLIDLWHQYILAKAFDQRVPKKMHGLRFFRHSYCWDWHCLGFMRFLRRRSLFFFWCDYVIITFHSTCPLADCWRIMRQLANMHCASMGLHETTLCCPSHEHLHVEQSIHRTTSYANWRVGDYTHPTCAEEACLRWLWKWCDGWAFSHLLNRETLLRVTVSIRRQ